MSNNFNDKKESLIKLLKCIEDHKLWYLSKYLILYINRNKNISEDFIDTLSDLIQHALKKAENIVEKNKLEKISLFIQGMKSNELYEEKENSNDMDILLLELNNI